MLLVLLGALLAAAVRAVRDARGFSRDSGANLRRPIDPPGLLQDQFANSGFAEFFLFPKPGCFSPGVRLETRPRDWLGANLWGRAWVAPGWGPSEARGNQEVREATRYDL